MTYELAKKLKDAGFPQPKIECYDPWVCCEHAYYYDDGDRNENPYHPTLSELISACGDGFKNLVRDGKYWWANASFRLDNNDIQGWKDSTPEEAVANLYLALHPVGRGETPEEAVKDLYDKLPR